MIDTLTGEPVLVSVPLHYAGFLCIVDVCHAWNLRQFLQELHMQAHITHNSSRIHIANLRVLYEHSGLP